MAALLDAAMAPWTGDSARYTYQDSVRRVACSSRLEGNARKGGVCTE